MSTHSAGNHAEDNLHATYGFSDPGMEDALHDNITIFPSPEAGLRPEETPRGTFRLLYRATQVDESTL